MAGGQKYLFQQISDGGFSVGAGHARQKQVFGRISIKPGGNGPRSPAGMVHQKDPFQTIRVVLGHHSGGPSVQGRPDKIMSVG